MGHRLVAGGYLRLRDELSHHFRHISDGSQVAAGQINRMVQAAAQRHLDKNLGGVFGVNHRRSLRRVEGHGHRLTLGRQGNHQAADHTGHAGHPTVAENRTDSDAPQIQPKAFPVLAGGKIVGRLGHPVNVDRSRQVFLGQRPVPKGFLHPVNRDGTGVNHPLNSGPAGYLKNVVGALNVDQHPEMGPVFRIRGQQGRHVDYPVNLVGMHRLQQMGNLGNVAPIEGRPGQVLVQRQVGPRRSQVEGQYRFAAFQQLADNAGTDESVAAGNHYCHCRASR